MICFTLCVLHAEADGIWGDWELSVECNAPCDTEERGYETLVRECADPLQIPCTRSDGTKTTTAADQQEIKLKSCFNSRSCLPGK